MSTIIEDDNGKWQVVTGVKLLIEPSVSYLAERELERQLAEQQGLLESIKPSEEEVKKAYIELVTLNTLMEVGIL